MPDSIAPLWKWLKKKYGSAKENITILYCLLEEYNPLWVKT